MSFVSKIVGMFLPYVVAAFIGASRLRAVLKMLPCHFIVEELQKKFQTTFSGKSDLPLHMLVDLGTGFIAVTMLCDRLTTAAGIEKLRQMLNLPRHVRISSAGLKDRWAWTSQLIVIPYKDMEKLKQILARQGTFEEAMRRHGVFFKDPHSVKGHLGKGHLEGNRFTIKVVVEGAPKDVLQNYMQAAMEKARSMKNTTALVNVAQAMNLAEGDILVPNAYGNQRKGARQNLDKIGELLVNFGAEAAFKEFLLATTSNEGHRARDLRREMAKEWNEAEESIADQRRLALESGDSAEIERTSKLEVIKMRMHLQGMLEVLEKPDRFANNRPNYEVCNMVYEWKLVKAMFVHLDYETVLRDPEVKDDVSLWFGAYQGYFFNQLQAKTITGDLHLETMLKETDDALDSIVDGMTDPRIDKKKLKANIRERNLRMMEVPLFSCEPVAMWFYQRFMPEAVPTQIDPLVRELFMCAGGNHKGPWRPPYVVPKGLEWNCEDGEVNFRFTLRSGAYATTFLGSLFNLVEAKKDKGQNKKKKFYGNRR